MKALRTTLFILALICTKPLFAQYAPVGTTWHYSFMMTFSFHEPIYQSYGSMSVLKDTVINDFTYSKIGGNATYTMLRLDSPIFLHKDQRKVYYFLDGKHNLLMDFSLNKGDTISIDIVAPKLPSVVDILHKKARIDSITYLRNTSTGDSLKQLHFSYYIDPADVSFTLFTDTFYSCFTEEIINEYTSPGNHFLGSVLTSRLMSGDVTAVRCYERPAIHYTVPWWQKHFVDPYSLSCDHIWYTGTKEISTSKDKVFPNPFFNTISIQVDQPCKSFQLFDLSGRKVFSYEKAFDGKIEISPDVLPGLYLLQLEYTNGSSTFKRIVKR